jgi:hypothetical protein
MKSGLDRVTEKDLDRDTEVVMDMNMDMDMAKDIELVNFS